MMMKDVIRAMLDGKAVGCRSAYTETHYRMADDIDMVYVRHGPDGEWKPCSTMLLEPFKEWFVVEEPALTCNEALEAMFKDGKACACDACPGKVYRVKFLKLCESNGPEGQCSTAMITDEMWVGKWRVVG